MTREEQKAIINEILRIIDTSHETSLYYYRGLHTAISIVSNADAYGVIITPDKEVTKNDTIN